MCYNTTSSTPSPRTPDEVLTPVRGGRTGMSTSGVSFLSSVCGCTCWLCYYVDGPYGGENAPPPPPHRRRRRHHHHHNHLPLHLFTPLACPPNATFQGEKKQVCCRAQRPGREPDPGRGQVRGQGGLRTHAQHTHAAPHACPQMTREGRAREGRGSGRCGGRCGGRAT